MNWDKYLKAVSLGIPHSANSLALLKDESCLFPDVIGNLSNPPSKKFISFSYSEVGA